MTPPPHRQRKQYDVKFSPLYKLSTKRKLAVLLGATLSDISSPGRCGLTAQYNIFKCKQSLRFITEPRGDLRIIHKRLLKLFSRIQTPGYVHSAIKKRSYLTNARSHLSSTNVLKIDLKKFFPSVKFHHVQHFFARTLRCTPDVATILAKLCTVETKLHGVHLPTGSCISPLLSYLVNQRMFDRISALCAAEGCVFTVYVDDVTISGDNATRALLTKVAVLIHNSGYGYHKIKTYHRVPATVTGVVLSNGKLRLPHIRAKRIRELGEALSCTTGVYRTKLLASLVGRLSEAEQIDPNFRLQRINVLREYAGDWKQVTEERAKAARAKLKAKLSNRPMAVNAPATAIDPAPDPVVDVSVVAA